LEINIVVKKSSIIFLFAMALFVFLLLKRQNEMSNFSGKFIYCNVFFA